MSQTDILSLIRSLSRREKAVLCSGLDMWSTKANEKAGIPAMIVSDGPHGLRHQLPDAASINESLPAVCFPSGGAAACSFDEELVRKIGRAIGREAKAQDVQVVLGPAVNIKRMPLGGRNFEYYSEDPYLSSHMAAALIEGIQAEGVGTSIKHFAANNQENRRMSINACISERTCQMNIPLFQR